jgi:2-polyprenyl-6-methoxyphenol hydroxylase-like FAD-dependent oxidoreductase
VLLNKRVVKVENVEGGVSVLTGGGDTFKGTLLIGADGIHSIIREEMTRIGNQLHPGYFPPGEADRVPCYYQCSFGIAQNVSDYNPGETTNVRTRGYSMLVISGPENRVYWFIFNRLPKPRFGHDIPRYTKEDEIRFVEKWKDLAITDKITFGQVYSKRLSSTLTPLHEVVYEKWFFGRIMTLGDSAHKVGTSWGCLRLYS